MPKTLPLIVCADHDHEGAVQFEDVTRLPLRSQAQTRPSLLTLMLCTTENCSNGLFGS